MSVGVADKHAQVAETFKGYGAFCDALVVLFAKTLTGVPLPFHLGQ